LNDVPVGWLRGPATDYVERLSGKVGCGDGIFTFFDFGDRWDSADLPAVYRVVDGVDTPVNTRIKGTMLIAEASGAFSCETGSERCACGRKGSSPKEPTSRRRAQYCHDQHDRGA
jgi:hypothetical protein